MISSREGVEIDHCPQCRGVWLDRGELDKVIERAAPSVVGSDGRRDERDRSRDDDRDRGHDRDDRYRGDDRSRKRKRGSFLEDIFDFG